MNGAARLLVVDDEPLNQEIIAEYLDDSPYRLDTADDGSVAWSMMEASPDAYDAVLLDRMMPQVSGDEVLRKLRQDSATATVPTIMITAVAAIGPHCTPLSVTKPATAIESTCA